MMRMLMVTMIFTEFLIKAEIKSLRTDNKSRSDLEKPFPMKTPWQEHLFVHQSRWKRTLIAMLTIICMMMMITTSVTILTLFKKWKARVRPTARLGETAAASKPGQLLGKRGLCKSLPGARLPCLTCHNWTAETCHTWAVTCHIPVSYNLPRSYLGYDLWSTCVNTVKYFLGSLVCQLLGMPGTPQSVECHRWPVKHVVNLCLVYLGLVNLSLTGVVLTCQVPVSHISHYGPMPCTRVKPGSDL